MIPENIVISNNNTEKVQDYIKRGQFSKIGVLVDENTHKLCYPLLQLYLPEHTVLEIKSGEENKNIQTCNQIWQWMTDEEFDRKSLLINLGGGVICDMGGFCAGTFKRGIKFINFPTTLLSQVDASVGGKLGVDFNGFKNHIGLFLEPEMVFINSRFLQTLDKREIRSGFAEIIKHSLIADAGYWPLITQKTELLSEWDQFIEHSVAIKHEVVSNDPTEKGLRKNLNFGHTIGHAIESFYLERPGERLLHGEAIAIGMICEAYLSHTKLGLPAASLKAIEAFILKVYGKPFIGTNHIAQICELTLQDKKNSNKIINCTLLETIGKAVFDIPISKQEIEESIQYYNEIKVD
jgi:3-dehydroquinate synthase